MSGFYLTAALLILLAVAAGLVRILRGAADGHDRLMAAQLIGSGGVAVLVLLSTAMGEEAVIDVALMLGLLAVFATVGFVNWRRPGDA